MFLENRARFSLSSGQPQPLNTPSLTPSWSKTVLLALLLSQSLPSGVMALPDQQVGVLQQIIYGLASVMGIGPGGMVIPSGSLEGTNTTSTTPSPGFTASSGTSTSTTTCALATTTASVPLRSGTNWTSSAVQTRAVFAHFMVGNVYNYTVDTWVQGEFLN